MVLVCRYPMWRKARIVELYSMLRAAGVSALGKIEMFTSFDQFGGILKSCWPVKSLSKGFSYQGSMRDMGPIDSSVDVAEETNALRLCDAFETSFVQDTVHHYIEHGFTSGSFHICTIN